jgi:hypothetical protein
VRGSDSTAARKRGRVKTSALGVAIAVTCALGAFVAATAVGHWAGFTQEAYFCDTTFVHKSQPGVNWCEYNSEHSWGFVSAKHQDTNGGTHLRTGATAWSSGATVFYNACSYCDTLRSCFDGVYPNCHDQDSTMLRPYIGLDWSSSPLAHALRGHGWY